MSSFDVDFIRLFHGKMTVEADNRASAERLAQQLLADNAPWSLPNVTRLDEHNKVLNVKEQAP